MYNEIFLLSLAFGITVLFSWAFKALPREDWQILACLPQKKGADGIWSGVNLTYYGFFNAMACCFAVAMFLVMMGSLNISLIGTISVIIPVLAICMPASRYIAGIVEKKPNTFSVGGASFTGIVVAPWIILLENMTLGKWFEFRIPVGDTLAALFIAYAFGEGIGRLACISFGCCYGKPLAACSPLMCRIFRRWSFVFWGKTKKIAYAHHLDCQPVIPVQALTAVIYTGCGLLCLYLFLKGKASVALPVILIVTQGWRFVSEFLRADYRGGGLISAYQIMALLAVGYTLSVAELLKEPAPRLPELLLGIYFLWNPGLIIFMVGLWITAFIYMGKSNVTCSAIDIQITEESSK